MYGQWRYIKYLKYQKEVAAAARLVKEAEAKTAHVRRVKLTFAAAVTLSVFVTVYVSRRLERVKIEPASTHVLG